MLNLVALIGRLTRDPELRKTTTGKSVMSFTLACDRGFGDKKRTDFVNLQAWNKQADFIANYLAKGALVAVEGSIQSRSYEDSSGKKVYVQEVLVNTIKSLSSKAENEAFAQGQGAYGAGSYSSSNQEAGYSTDDYAMPSFEADEPVLDITSDDLPFKFTFKIIFLLVFIFKYLIKYLKEAVEAIEIVQKKKART